MYLSNVHLNRRTVLKGLGATIALPFLDAMVPAFTPLVRTAAAPARRLNVVYLPNGMAMDYWLPKTEGPSFEITPVLLPLAAFRNQMTIVSGLTQRRPGSEGGGNHAHASTKFLTGFPGRRAKRDRRRRVVQRSPARVRHIGRRVGDGLAERPAGANVRGEHQDDEW